MLSQCLVPSITKKGISYLLVLGQEPALWLKSTQTVEMKEKIFSHSTYSNLTPYLFFIKKYFSVSVTFKIEISQFYDWSEAKQWKWNKIRFHIQIRHHIFFIKKYSSILINFKIKLSPFNDYSKTNQ